MGITNLEEIAANEATSISFFDKIYRNVGNRSPNVSGNGGNDRNSGGGNDKKKYDGNNGGGDGKFGKRAPDSHYHDDKNRKHQKRN